MTTHTMRALQQNSADGPAGLRLVENEPVPVPRPDEVLVSVTAAGVNFADVMQTFGTYGNGPTAPYLAGFEAAGEIVAVGASTSTHRVGDHVIGTGSGAFAEFVAMPAAGTLPVPDGWADEQALGLVLNWATALAALKPLGRLVAGETVVVPAAAGGVGQAAVRMALHYGADMIALASPSKHSVVRALGAQTVLDADRPDLADEIVALCGGGADLVLDATGGAAFEAALAATRRVTGRLVVYGTAAGNAAVTNHDLVFRHQVQVIGLHIGAVAQSAPEVFDGIRAELLNLIEAGVYPPGTPEIHPLADGPRVLWDLSARRTTGKLALRP